MLMLSFSISWLVCHIGGDWNWFVLFIFINNVIPFGSWPCLESKRRIVFLPLFLFDGWAGESMDHRAAACTAYKYYTALNSDENWVDTTASSRSSDTMRRIPTFTFGIVLRGRSGRQIRDGIFSVLAFIWLQSFSVLRYGPVILGGVACVVSHFSLGFSGIDFRRGAREPARNRVEKFGSFGIVHSHGNVSTSSHNTKCNEFRFQSFIVIANCLWENKIGP
mmetsp:Transcript_27888/g.52288  ORF Transcript_27888/g.52288 Transcript_27888/m.52288 type:complete len:221 (+) Transcript_27888:927-1589(+)